MRIKINSIQAVIIDSSTYESEHFIISYWKIEYTVIQTGIINHSNLIEGKLNWKEDVDIDKILNYIKSLFK